METKSQKLIKRYFKLRKTLLNTDKIKPEKVIELIETIDEYFEEQNLIEQLWERRCSGKFVDWDKVKKDL